MLLVHVFLVNVPIDAILNVLFYLITTLNVTLEFIVERTIRPLAAGPRALLNKLQNELYSSVPWLTVKGVP